MTYASRIVRLIVPIIILTASSLAAATNVRDIVGSNHIGTLYTFKQWPCSPADTCDILNEGANELLFLGTRTIRVELYANPVALYRFTANPPFPWVLDDPPAERLRNMAMSRQYDSLFRKPFSTIVMTVRCNLPYTMFGGGEDKSKFSLCGNKETGHLPEGAPLFDDFTATERQTEKMALKNLAAYLLQTFAGTGKTFIIVTNETDWVAREPFGGDASFPITPARAQIMRDWINARQDGVNEARRESTATGVTVLNAMEVNAVDLAIAHSGITMTNDVVPYTYCDLYSYTVYGGEMQTPALLTERLDYLASKAPDSPVYGSKNIFIGEYAAGENADFSGDTAAAALALRRQREIALAWGVRHLFCWTLYDGAVLPEFAPWNPELRPGNQHMYGYWLVRPDGTRPPLYGEMQDIMPKSIVHGALQTQTQRFVSADDAGGASVRVDAPSFLDWEYLTLVDHNGGSLASGDEISILTKNGHHLMALNGGGGAVDATSTNELSWERFTIVEVGGGGAIDDHDLVAIRAASGHYFSAGSGGLLRADAASIGASSTFSLVVRETPTHQRFDGDGDGLAELTIYRDGAWLRFPANTGVWTGQQSASCIPAPADYDGNGITDMSLLCGGTWYFYNAAGTQVGQIATGGGAGDLPVPADYDGDGKDEVALYRNGSWLAFDRSTGALKWTVVTSGFPNAIPLPMDYDGDGGAEFTLYQGGVWRFYGDTGVLLKAIWTGGVTGDVPVPGDYKGDRAEEIVVFRGGAWQFYDFNTSALTGGVWTGATPFNGSPLQPAPLDYDGDGKVDFTIYAGGPWHTFYDDGTYRGGFWTGGVAGDQALSRKQHVSP